MYKMILTGIYTANPRVIIKMGVIKKLINITGRRPRRSVKFTTGELREEGACTEKGYHERSLTDRNATLVC